MVADDPERQLQNSEKPFLISTHECVCVWDHILTPTWRRSTAMLGGFLDVVAGQR